MKQGCDIDAHATSRVSDCRMVVLPVHAHENGNLSVVENSGTFPFAVQRVYYMYDIPAVPTVEAIRITIVGDICWL